MDQEAIETNFRKLRWIEDAIRSVEKRSPRVSIDSYLSRSDELDKNCQDVCDLILGTYVNIELANHLTKHTLLVIRQILDVFNASRNKSLSKKQVKKCWILKLDSQYLSRFMKISFSEFTSMHECIFGFSFLTTLNIYKDCFKGRQRWRKCKAKLCSCKL